MLRSLAATALIVVCARAVPAQDTASRPAFEVATIKPDPDTGAFLVNILDGKFNAVGYTLRDLIAYAYGVDARQVIGGPKWSESDKYDVVGKPEKTGPLNRNDAGLMVQALLAERFQLKVHNDTREMPVYVLTVAKGGAKLKPRTENDGGPRGMRMAGAMMPGRGTQIAFLASTLSNLVLDRPVLDQTGLAGRFDFDLHWRPDPNQFHGAGDRMPSNPDDPDLFTALQEQLGLKLEAQKGPAPVIVVDGAEKPSEN